MVKIQGNENWEGLEDRSRPKLLEVVKMKTMTIKVVISSLLCTNGRSLKSPKMALNYNATLMNR